MQDRQVVGIIKFLPIENREGLRGHREVLGQNDVELAAATSYLPRVRGGLHQSPRPSGLLSLCRGSSRAMLWPGLRATRWARRMVADRDAALRSLRQLVLSSQPAYTGKRRHLSVQRKGLEARERVSVRNKPVEEAGAAR